MFLFSTQATRDTTATNPVVGAIRDGAEKTGAGFDYLLKTAQRESGMNPEAKAKTSSATGLFQFIEQTWLAMVKQEGGKQGLGDYADAISSDSSGRLTVADASTRDKILQLRSDPQVAAVMAGALTQKNGEQLASALGRQPLAGELYMAHVLGARGATDLIRTAATDPTRAAASDFPDAAAANRGIFYDKGGRARSAQEVYGVLAASHANTQAAATTSAATAAAGQGVGQPVQIASGLAPGKARGLVGLFSTEGSRQPVSAAVANLWSTPRNNATTRLASADPSERYFPGAVQSDAAPAVTVSSETVAAATSVTAPLPPARPADLAVAPVRQARARSAPLDLSSFMTQRAGT